MKRFIINETERQRILNMHESASKRQYLNENLEQVLSDLSSDERYKHNKTIQCFLNKKGITDNEGNKLVIDGSIGNYPKSKSAQAIYKYQEMIKVYPVDGVWGPDTYNKMPTEDKKIFEECMSNYDDLIDKIIKFLF